MELRNAYASRRMIEECLDHAVLLLSEALNAELYKGVVLLIGVATQRIQIAEDLRQNRDLGIL